MKHARVLVADPLAIFRSGVATLLARESDFEVVEATDFDEVMLTIADDCVDLALIDLELPPRGAVAAVAALTEHCETYTIVWSFDPSRATVFRAIRAGASGYLHKEIGVEGLLRALRGAVRGEAALSRDLVALMIEEMHGFEERERARERAGLLSPREREVLALVANGARTREIADQLAISEFTVKRHVQNILHKLQLPSRRAAASVYRAAFEPEETMAGVKGTA